MTYAEKLKDPRWQKKRLEILQRDEWKCRKCNKSDKTLVVHHIIYTEGKDPWNYPDYNFMTLCEECHSDIHNKSSIIRRMNNEIICEYLEGIGSTLLSMQILSYIIERLKGNDHKIPFEKL